MIKASALYIVIIISLVIGLLCSALIAAAYFYNMQFAVKASYDRLSNDLNSGINLLAASPSSAYIKQETFSLFDNTDDSVSLKQINWGIYNIGIVKAFNQKDTLFKTFSMGYTVDSSKWSAVYLMDHDRPFLLSGKTRIIGDAFIPKAGVQQAYVNNIAYQGDKRLISGTRHLSEKKLPLMAEDRLRQLELHFDKSHTYTAVSLQQDSTTLSFLREGQVINFKKEVAVIKDKYLSGNLVLLSDTTIILDGTAVLKNILVFAKNIIVRDGFNGTCQLFATNAILVGKACNFGYPSCLGTLHFSNSSLPGFQSKINLADNTIFSGTIFTFQKQNEVMAPIISLGKNVRIRGQVYSQGILELMNNTEIDGSVFTGSFLYRNSTTIFENYLMNATIDAKALSPYYLTGELLPFVGKKEMILQWLEAN